MRKFVIASAATAALSVAAPAQADTVLVSEDFESSLGAFTASGQAVIATGNDYVPCCGTTGSPGNMGNHFVTFGSGNVPSGLITTNLLTLLLGETYTLTFDYRALGDPQLIDPITATIGSFTFTVFPSGNNNLDNPYNTALFSFLGDGSSSQLQFAGGGVNNVDGVIDNVLFTTSAVAPVPEPGTWAMMLLGFGAVGFAMRRSARRRSHLLQIA